MEVEEQATVPDQEETKPEPPESNVSYTLEVLQIIKESQQQHGLRHGDYQRYRSYCSRRLRRIRKSLKFVYGNRNKYVSRKIKEETIMNVRFLYLPLICAERCWAYMMQLKQESNTEPRKRFHLMARLLKAVRYAEELETLSQSDKCDARSKLEAQAYCAWMKGTLYFEKEQWEECIKMFSTAQNIYEKLASTFSEDQRLLYLQRVEEITPSIRYCAYNIGDQTAIKDLVQLRLKSGGMMSSNIDSLLAQTREKQALTLSEVTWRGRLVPVKNEQVRAFLLSCEENEKQLKSSSDPESQMSIYESLLMECKDALQILRDEIKADPAVKQRAHKSDGPIPSSQYLYTYLMYIRLTKTIERNMLMVETLKENLPEAGMAVAGPTTQGSTNNKKVTKPQDLIRIYDTILQNLAEIPQLAGLEDDDNLQQEIKAKSLKFKAFRCFYLAQSYTASKKWREASALYERVLKHIETANKEFKRVKGKTKNELAELKHLTQKVNGLKYSAHALSILDSEEITEGVAQLEVTKDKRAVSERLHKYQDGPELATGKPNLVPFPPDFQPIPCKPLFFDIALNQVELPSLEDKLEQKPAAGGITGFLKGWWGGGKK
ncbi:signal recognition particle subunit SRP68-like [Acanthaster planci]|uniref:Signal recognition particle subunit SRP68 n=1 Tax=Acanthaster planci TaxID=133434 RepID=A0A8B7Y9Y0_ACAPL|nr:signal recognition particle subunit SRP68-like [Acanthaster planci]